jgi:hypothetical protein
VNLADFQWANQSDTNKPILLDNFVDDSEVIMPHSLSEGNAAFPEAHLKQNSILAASIVFPAVDQHCRTGSQPLPLMCQEISGPQVGHLHGMS